MTDPRVRPEFAAPQHVKLARNLTSKFPDVPPADKLAGVEVLTKGGQELMTLLEPHYFAFVDLVDFHSLALDVMTEAARDVPEFKMEVNPDLMESFLDLFVVFAQTVLLCNAIEERKLLLSFHSVLYGALHTGGKDPGAAKVMQFMKDFPGGDYTLKRLWEILKPVGTRVVNGLVALFPNWIKVRNTELLRNDGILSLNIAPQKLLLPASQPIYDELMRTPKVNNWFYYGFLLSPEEIAVNQAAQDTLRFVIADTYAAPLYRDVHLPLAKEWDELSGYKTKTVSMSKVKKPFKEGSADLTTKCAQTHRDRRLFVRQELLLLKLLLSDTPALLGPKLPLVLAALSMAKDELAWLYRNKPYGLKSKSEKPFFDDPFVPELVHLMLHLTNLVRSCKDYLVDYYCQYLRGADTTRLDEMINEARFKSSTDADVQTVLGWMIGWIRTAEPGRHFGDVRQKWAEVQTVFISAARAVPATVIMPVVERVQLIMLHTRIVDSFEDLVSEHASLRSLWYFRAEMQLAFERSIVDGSPISMLAEVANGAPITGESATPANGDVLVTTVAPLTDVASSNATAHSPATNAFPLHCLTFLPFASAAIENATQYDPFERERLGQDAVTASLDLVRKVMDAVTRDLDILSRYHMEFELQLEGVKAVDAFSNKLNELVASAAAANAASAQEAVTIAQAQGADPARLAALNQAAQTAAAAAKRAMDKAVPVDVEHPGAESSYSHRPQLSSLRASFKHLWQLLSAIDEFGTILVYNTLITPREYLISAIKKLFKTFLERNRYLPNDKSAFKDEQTIISPQHLQRVGRTFSNFIKQLDLYIQIDTDLIVNQVLLKQVYSTSLGVTGGKLDWMTDKGFEYSDNVIKCVAKWYSDFFARRITNPSLNVVYSPNRRGFVSKPVGSSSSVAFKAEKYLDLVELTKLASVLGPYGVKIIDREILRFVVSNMSTLLGTLRTLRADLTELSSTYSQESTTNTVLKALKPADLDSFIGSSIVIGNALTFRRLLYRALGDAAKKTIPHLHNAVSNAFHQYLRNTFMAVDFVGMDSMAQDAGVDVSIADQPLKVALLPLSTSDRALWDLLPAAYAAAFLISSHWKDAIYNPTLEAFENNAHVLSATISELLINFKALSGDGNNDENTIREQLVKFLDISGTILLRTLAAPKPDPKLVPKDFASLFVFLDLFIDDCPLLSRAELEPIIPYSLLRSMWRGIYSKAGKGKSDELDL